MDRVTREVRSRIMSHVRGKNTAPEMALRRALHARGIRFRVHNRNVPGTPDISHSGARVAVFVDGCFWHGCPTHYRAPTSRKRFWARKLAYNTDLRRRVRNRLEASDWVLVELWECKVRDEVGRLARHVGALIRKRRASDPVK
ncbi:MAG: very short patch repair endonuclease [Thermoplasmatota archaeon]